MDAEQNAALCQIAPEALEHAKVTRQGLRDSADKKGVRPERLLIPNNGETVRLYY